MDSQRRGQKRPYSDFDSRPTKRAFPQGNFGGSTPGLQNAYPTIPYQNGFIQQPTFNMAQNQPFQQNFQNFPQQQFINQFQQPIPQPPGLQIMGMDIASLLRNLQQYGIQSVISELSMRGILLTDFLRAIDQMQQPTQAPRQDISPQALLQLAQILQIQQAPAPISQPMINPQFNSNPMNLAPVQNQFMAPEHQSHQPHAGQNGESGNPAKGRSKEKWLNRHQRGIFTGPSKKHEPKATHLESPFQIEADLIQLLQPSSSREPSPTPAPEPPKEPIQNPLPASPPTKPISPPQPLKKALSPPNTHVEAPRISQPAHHSNGSQYIIHNSRKAADQQSKPTNPAPRNPPNKPTQKPRPQQPTQQKKQNHEEKKPSTTQKENEQIKWIQPSKERLMAYIQEHGKHDISSEKVLASELIEAIQNALKKDDILIRIIKSLKAIQELKEEEVQKERKSLLEAHAEKRTALQQIHQMRLEANQLAPPEKLQAIQMKYHNERNTLETEIQEELAGLTRRTLKEFDQQATNQQTVLCEAGVPGFFVTTDPNDITIQKLILEEISKIVS